MTPAAAVTYERSRRLANVAVFTVRLQVRRLRSVEPEDSRFVLRRWADFDLLIVALTRLRRAATLAASISEIRNAMNAAIAKYDSALPDLRLFRNVSEHVDDYARGRGRASAVDHKDLEVSTMGEPGPTLTWLGRELNATLALKASEELFRAIQAVVPGSANA